MEIVPDLDIFNNALLIENNEEVFNIYEGLINDKEFIEIHENYLSLAFVDSLQYATLINNTDADLKLSNFLDEFKLAPSIFYADWIENINKILKGFVVSNVDFLCQFHNKEITQFDKYLWLYAINSEFDGYINVKIEQFIRECAIRTLIQNQIPIERDADLSIFTDTEFVKAIIYQDLKPKIKECMAQFRTLDANDEKYTFLTKYFKADKQITVTCNNGINGVFSRNWNNDEKTCEAAKGKIINLVENNRHSIVAIQEITSLSANGKPICNLWWWSNSKRSVATHKQLQHIKKRLGNELHINLKEIHDEEKVIKQS